MSGSAEQTEQSKLLNTYEEYMQLCTGGHGLMYTGRMMSIYRVTQEQIANLVHEAAERIAGDEELLRGALTVNNSAEWKTARSVLFDWLERDSSWNTSSFFGVNNTTVPLQAKKESMARIVQDARNEVKHNGAAYDIDPRIKQEYAGDQHVYGRSAAPSPARSFTSVAASQFRHMRVSDPVPTIPTLRSGVLAIDMGDNKKLLNRTMKQVLHPADFAEYTKVLRPSHAVYDRLVDLVTPFTDIGKDDMLFEYNGNSFCNQHEFEAALNDYANGIRLPGQSFNINIQSANPTRGRRGMCSGSSYCWRQYNTDMCIAAGARPGSHNPTARPARKPVQSMPPIDTQDENNHSRRDKPSDGGQNDGKDGGGKGGGGKSGGGKSGGGKGGGGKGSESDSPTTPKTNRKPRRRPTVSSSPERSDTPSPQKQPSPEPDPTNLGKLAELDLDPEQEDPDVDVEEEDPESLFLET